MYAIVEIAGQQFKVEEGKKIFVHRLEPGDDKKIMFDKVLLIEDNDRIIIGEPVIKDAVVEGKVLEHVRGDKIIVFKKKRRKGYRVKNGHRQNFTCVEIVDINEKGSEKKAAQKKEEKVVAETKASEKAVKDQKTTEKKAAARKPSEKKAEKEKAPAKKTATRKAAEKKSVQKKTTAKKPPKGKA
jgi:large subunit ribosomal protein L21